MKPPVSLTSQTTVDEPGERRRISSRQAGQQVLAARHTHHRGASGRQVERETTPETRRRSGDDGHRSSNLEHGVLLCWSNVARVGHPGQWQHCPMDAPRTARAMWKLFEPLHAVTYFVDECIEEYGVGGSEGLLDGLLRRSGRSHGRGDAGRRRRHLLQLQSRPGRAGPPRRLGLRGTRPGARGPAGRGRPFPAAGSSAPTGAGRRYRRRRFGPGRRAGALGGRGTDRSRVDRWRRPTWRWPGPTSPTWRCGRRPPCCASTAATATSRRWSRPAWTAARRWSRWRPPVRCPRRCSRRPGVGTTTPGTRRPTPWWSGAG